MSVEVLEERAIEAPAAVEAETQKERCATLGGAAIACAGCPFVRFCAIKSEVEQGSPTEEVAGKSPDQNANVFGLSEPNSLFPETNLFSDIASNADPQPEKVITPLPHEVKNTTINYIDRLMDDTVEFVFANSIEHPAESSRSNVLPKPSIDPGPTEVEQPISTHEALANPVKIKADQTVETLELASRSQNQRFETPEVAPVDNVDLVADLVKNAEIIAGETRLQIEEKIIFPKNITKNILRPKSSVVKKAPQIETIQKIKKNEIKVDTVVSDSVDSPIFYNDELEEIIEAKEELAEIIVEDRTETKVVLGPVDQYVDVIEISESVIETEDMVEEVEPIQLKATKQPEAASRRVNWAEAPEETLPASRLAEALLNGNDDMVDPESHLVGRKITSKLKILRQLALRALMFGL